MHEFSLASRERRPCVLSGARGQMRLASVCVCGRMQCAPDRWAPDVHLVGPLGVLAEDVELVAEWRGGRVAGL